MTTNTYFEARIDVTTPEGPDFIDCGTHRTVQKAAASVAEDLYGLCEGVHGEWEECRYVIERVREDDESGETEQSTISANHLNPAWFVRWDTGVDCIEEDLGIPTIHGLHGEVIEAAQARENASDEHGPGEAPQALEAYIQAVRVN